MWILTKKIFFEKKIIKKVLRCLKFNIFYVLPSQSIFQLKVFSLVTKIIQFIYNKNLYITYENFMHILLLLKLLTIYNFIISILFSL